MIRFVTSPVSASYPPPQAEFVPLLRTLSKAADCCRHPNIVAVNTYREAGLPGTSDKMIARESVVSALESALEELPDGYQFWIFDAFRSRRTQLAIFEMIFSEQQQRHPHLSHDEIFALTRKFVAHPEERSRFAVPPHNSGGAVDLTIAFRGQALDMGTAFDETSPLSSTASFEQEFPQESEISRARWHEVRNNRRLLFNLMKQAGFVNYEAEWWHYDLGDCIWANTHSQTWFYDSMELGESP